MCVRGFKIFLECIWVKKKREENYCLMVCIERWSFVVEILNVCGGIKGELMVF